MALTKKIEKDLRGKVEERAPGTITPTGLYKVADGSLIAKSTTLRARTAGPADIEDAEKKMAELEALREAEAEKPKRRTRSRKKEQAEPVEPEVVNAKVTVEGFGVIPTQYAHVYPGTGIAILGLTALSFVPQITDISDPANLTPHVVQIDVLGEGKYVYLGNTFIDKEGVENIILDIMEV